MKVTFVYPAFENLGIEYLSAVLKQAGHQTELVFDPQLFNDLILINTPLARIFSHKQKVLRAVEKSQPDLVAFSLSSPNFVWGLAMAEAIKARMDVPIVFGGMHISAVPEKAICKPFVDYCVVGEGEHAIVELANALEDGARELDIPNLWYKRKDGTVVSRDVRPLIQDLDSLPFPDKQMYQDVSSLFKFGYTALTGRGCTARCTFCHHSFYGPIYQGKGAYLRKRSVDNVVEELRHAKRSGATLIRFYDDNFTYNGKWIEEFSEKYKREIGLPFYCMGNPETITENIARCLENAGCYEIQVGVQTLADSTRANVLNRRETTAEVIRAIESMKKTKVRIVTDNLLDIPGQEESELLELARFYNRHRVDRINIYWTTYFARTGLVEIARQKGMLSDSVIRTIEEAPSNRATYVGQGDSSKQLRKHQLLLAVLLFLPMKVVDFIIDKRLVRFLPRVPPFLVTTLVSHLRSPRSYRFFETRARRRYLEFAVRRFWPGA